MQVLKNLCWDTVLRVSRTMMRFLMLDGSGSFAIAFDINSVTETIENEVFAHLMLSGSELLIFLDECTQLTDRGK